MFQSKIRIGTRTSKLALAQVQEVQNLLATHISPSQIEIVPITTSGDKIQDRSLAELGGKGLFVKELEEALLQNKIDVAVHSAKDVPPITHPETEIAAFSARLDARDYFISAKFSTINDLPEGAVVGTSSARRKAILLRLRPDLNVVNFRGNVDTRLVKISNHEVDASVVAVCGLKRLEKEISAEKIIERNIMLPSGGQGALALQTRSNDREIIFMLAQINDKKTAICVRAERSFLQNLGASCVTPVAVHAWIESDKLNLKTLILDRDGSEVFETSASCAIDLNEGVKLGELAAQKTKLDAAELLKRII